MHDGKYFSKVAVYYNNTFSFIQCIFHPNASCRFLLTQIENIKRKMEAFIPEVELLCLYSQSWVALLVYMCNRNYYSREQFVQGLFFVVVWDLSLKKEYNSYVFSLQKELLVPKYWVPSLRAMNRRDCIGGQNMRQPGMVREMAWRIQNHRAHFFNLLQTVQLATAPWLLLLRYHAEISFSFQLHGPLRPLSSHMYELLLYNANSYAVCCYDPGN